MLEKPNLPDAQIMACLKASFDVDVTNLEFLPLGYDASAWVYRVDAGSARYFLKLRQGELDMAMLTVPHYLKKQGIQTIVAPLETKDGQLFASLEEYSLILYPWVDGISGWDLQLSDEQWRDWGDMMRRIHDMPMSESLKKMIRRETFISKWDMMFHRVDKYIQMEPFSDVIQQQTADFWNHHRKTIYEMYGCMVALRKTLQGQTLPFVICHADIHKFNIIGDAQGLLWIVDWDEVIIAPKERDLMFFIGDGRQQHEVDAFLAGYGDCEINYTALAYYRYEWVVQEFADFGERIFFNDQFGEHTKQESLNGIKELFDEGNVIDLARRAYEKL